MLVTWTWDSDIIVLTMIHEQRIKEVGPYQAGSHAHHGDQLSSVIRLNPNNVSVESLTAGEMLELVAWAGGLFSCRFLLPSPDDD